MADQAIARQSVEQARQQLLGLLQEHALKIGKVVLSSGQTAEYYVDAKRAMLLPDAFKALGILVADFAAELGATAVGGLTMGADPVANSALSVPGIENIKAFSVRKVKKDHGMQRWIEGPELNEDDQCLVVEDVVTTGSSSQRAVERIRQEGFKIVGALSVVDRLAGGGDAISSVVYPAPYKALFTIDEIYPDRPH